MGSLLGLEQLHTWATRAHLKGGRDRAELGIARFVKCAVYWMVIEVLKILSDKTFIFQVGGWQRALRGRRGTRDCSSSAEQHHGSPDAGTQVDGSQGSVGRTHRQLSRPVHQGRLRVRGDQLGSRQLRAWLLHRGGRRQPSRRQRQLHLHHQAHSG